MGGLWDWESAAEGDILACLAQLESISPAEASRGRRGGAGVLGFLGLRISGLGFRGFGVWDFGFRIPNPKP